jgi:hypothetical protein
MKDPHPLRCALAFALAFTPLLSVPARSESSLGTSVVMSGDDRGFRWDRYELALRRETPEQAQWLSARFHSYSLAEELAGVLPFDGSEPAGEIGAHLLQGWWWLLGAVGFQGNIEASGATGKLIVARAIPAGTSTLTPRLEAAREPLALTALPLSLGLSKYRFDAVLAAGGDAWKAEGGARLELWEEGHLPGRTRNPALDAIAANRSALLHAYGMLALGRSIDVGLAARAAWAARSTMLLTESTPVPVYTWYPASAPPFEWATAAVLDARGRPAEPLEIGARLQLPLLSRETRDWEGVRRPFWGSAAFEGRLDASWKLLSGTTLQLDAAIFVKPWASWDVLSHEAYRQGLVRLSLEQRL